MKRKKKRGGNSGVVKTSAPGSLMANARQSLSKDQILSTGGHFLMDSAVCISGGYLGSLIGRPSLYTGGVIALVGTICKSKLLTIGGLGMAVGGSLTSKSVSGLSGLDGAKERGRDFLDSLIHRSYMDKVIKKKTGAAPGAAANPTNGFGSTGEGYNDFELEYQRVMGLLDSGAGSPMTESTTASLVSGLDYLAEDISGMNY